jgi:DNA-binding CsgD family transcriptional regulator
MTQAIQVPRSVRIAAARARNARGAEERLRKVFEQSPVPMVLVDGERRFIDANRPARLVFRLSLEELRVRAVDDLTPPEFTDVLEEVWGRLLAEGCVAGHYVAGPPGGHLEIVFSAVADALPGFHAGAFAPATWPEDELETPGDDVGDPPASLTPREIEVLTLAARGHSGPEIAAHLMLSPATVKTHFSNLHGKLEVPNRTAAVALALKLGLID